MRHLLVLFLFFCLEVSAFDGHFLISQEEERYVITKEDQKRLGQFAAMHACAIQKIKSNPSIPTVFHFIWLGPKPFPEASIQYLKSWRLMHPDWKFKFWTDLKRELPEGVEEQFTQELDLGPYEELYYNCDNFGERSQLLRYLILFKEGGIYVDHDVECLKNISLFQQKHDFFCGLEPISTSILSSSINPSCHLLGAAPNHPILASTLQWLKKEWKRLENQYVGKDSSSLLNRVHHRTFRALSIGIEKQQNKEGRSDIIFPSSILSGKKRGPHVVALHHHLGTWQNRILESDVKWQNKLLKTFQGFQETFSWALQLSLVNALGLAFIGYFLLKKRCP